MFKNHFNSHGNSELEKDNPAHVENELSFFNKSDPQVATYPPRHLYGVATCTLFICMIISIALGQISTKVSTPNSLAPNNYYSAQLDKNDIVQSQLQILKGRSALVANVFQIKPNIKNGEAVELLGSLIDGRNLSNIPASEIGKRIAKSTTGEEQALSLDVILSINELTDIRDSLIKSPKDQVVPQKTIDRIVQLTDNVINYSNMMESSFH